MKKILSIVLALAIMMTVVSSMAFAATPVDTYENLIISGGSGLTSVLNTDGVYEISYTSNKTSDKEWKLTPDFNFDLNGALPNTYSHENGGYLVVSYTLNLAHGVPSLYVRASMDDSSTIVRTNVGAGEHHLEFVYDLANKVCYPYIDGVAGTAENYIYGSVNNPTTNFSKQRIMLAGLKEYSAGEIIMTVTPPVTKEYGTDVTLAELQAAAITNTYNDKVSIFGKLTYGGSFTVDNRVATIAAGKEYGSVYFPLWNEILFNQTADKKVKYMHFHTSFTSDSDAGKVYLSARKTGDQVVQNLVLEKTAAGTEYSFDAVVDVQNKTFDWYVNGAPLRLGQVYTATTHTGFNRFYLYLYNDKTAAHTYTFGDSYIVQYYEDNNDYSSFEELSESCKTEDVYFNYAGIVETGKTDVPYSLISLIIGANNSKYYNVYAAYDENDVLLFAHKYNPGVSSGIVSLEGVSYVKTYTWEAGTLKPVIPAQPVGLPQ